MDFYGSNQIATEIIRCTVGRRLAYRSDDCWSSIISLRIIWMELVRSAYSPVEYRPTRIAFLFATWQMVDVVTRRRRKRCVPSIGLQRVRIGNESSYPIRNAASVSAWPSMALQTEPTFSSEKNFHFNDQPAQFEPFKGNFHSPSAVTRVFLSTQLICRSNMATIFGIPIWKRPHWNAQIAENHKRKCSLERFVIPAWLQRIDRPREPQLMSHTSTAINSSVGNIAQRHSIFVKTPSRMDGDRELEIHFKVAHLSMEFVVFSFDILSAHIL